MADTFDFRSWSIDLSDLSSLLYRSSFLPSLVRLQQEELIANLVPFDYEQIEAAKSSWLDGKELATALSDSHLTLDELHLTLHKPSALMRYAHYRFGPGLEETYLSSQGSRDQVVYSLLRSRSYPLIRE